MEACPVAILIANQAGQCWRPSHLQLQPQFNPHVVWVSDSDVGPLFWGGQLG